MKAKTLTVKIAKSLILYKMLKNVKIKKKRRKACDRYERHNAKLSKTQPLHLLKAPIQCAELRLSLSEVHAKPKNKITTHEVSCRFLQFMFFSW